jgi:hypothetical protein
LLQQAWQVSESGGADLIGPHKSSITGAKQKLGVDQRTQQRVARGTIKAPQPLRLGQCQPQTRHFDVFPLNAAENIIERLRVFGWHWLTPSGSWSGRTVVLKSNLRAIVISTNKGACHLQKRPRAHGFVNAHHTS